MSRTVRSRWMVAAFAVLATSLPLSLPAQTQPSHRFSFAGSAVAGGNDFARTPDGTPNSTKLNADLEGTTILGTGVLTSQGARLRGGTDGPSLGLNTIEIWLKLTSLSPATQVAFDIRTVNGRLRFRPAQPRPELLITQGASTVSVAIGEAALPLNQFLHFVFTIDGNGVFRVYRDGAPEFFQFAGNNIRYYDLNTTFDPGAYLYDTIDSVLGGENVGDIETDTVGNRLQGSITEVRFWHTVFDQSRVSASTAAGPLTLPGIPHYVHRWDMGGTNGEFEGDIVMRDAVAFAPAIVANAESRISGNQLSFAGSALDEVPALAGGSFSELSSLTIDAWVTWTGSGSQPVFSCAGLVLWATTSPGSNGLLEVSGQKVLGATPFPSGVATHVTATLDAAADVARVYVNGVLAGENTGLTATTLGQTAQQCRIGGSGGSSFFTGSMNELRILDFALTGNHLLILHNGGAESTAGPLLPDAAIRIATANGVAQSTALYPAGLAAATTQRLLDVAGTVDDPFGRVDHVRWTNNRGGTAVADFVAGSGTWSADDIILRTGVNVVTISARDAGGAVLHSHAITMTVTDVTPPAISFTDPASLFETTSPTAILRGAAGDDFEVTSVTWARTSPSPLSGIATGTDSLTPGNAARSWLVHDAPLEIGTNAFEVCAVDAAAHETCTTRQFVRLDRATVLGAVQVEVNGSQLTDGVDLTLPGAMTVSLTPQLGVTAIHVLLDGIAAPGVTSGTSTRVWTGDLPLEESPRGLVAVSGDPAHEIVVLAELEDGTSVEVDRFTVGILSTITPTTPAGFVSWTQLPPPGGSGGIVDLAFTADGEIWAVAGDDLVVTPQDSVVVVGEEIRYTTTNVASATRRLLHFDGSSWTSFTPADLGNGDAILTAVAYQEGAPAPLWIGTDRGLLAATPQAAGAPDVTTSLDMGPLAGDFVSDLDVMGDDLVVAHRLTSYYRLHPSAQRRYLVNPGGISVHGGTNPASGWTSVAADVDALGAWTGPAGFDQLAAAWAGGSAYWTAAGANGLSRFESGDGWSYAPVGPGGLTLTGARRIDAETVMLPDPEGGPDEVEQERVWVAASDGAAMLAGSNWSVYSAANAGTLPSDDVRDVHVDGEHRGWFATSAGVASFDLTRGWAAHPDAGGGVARALGEAGTAAVGAATDGGTDVAVGDFGLTPEWTEPAGDTRVPTDATGLGSVDLEWTVPGGAVATDILLDQVHVLRIEGTAREVRMRPGAHRIALRAVFADGTHGPVSAARRVEAVDAVVREPIGVVGAFTGVDTSAGGCCPEIANRPRALDVFRDSSGTWHSSTVDLKIEPIQGQAGIDVAAAAGGAIAAFVAFNSNLDVDQYPTDLPINFTQQPIGHDAVTRLDRTAEPSGLVACEQGSDHVLLYNALEQDVPVDLPASLTCVDVAGLPGGRAAVLTAETIEVFERTRPFAPVRAVRSVAVENGLALASFRDGGLAVLTADEVVLFDAEGGEVDRVPIVVSSGSVTLHSDPLSPRDLTVDRLGRLFVLLANAAVTESRLFHAVPAGQATEWEEIDVSLTGGEAVAAIDAWGGAPAIGRAEPVPYEPPAEPPASSGGPSAQILHPVAGDPELWVLASGGFTGGTANPGTVSLLGFLEVDAIAGTASVQVDAGELRCTGTACALRLHFDPDLYETAVDGVPARFANGIPLLTGPFTVDLLTGAIEGSNFTLDLIDLAPVDVLEAGILGMGDRYGVLPRTGIGLRGSFDSASLLGGNLCFRDLLLGDFGGELHATFGQPGLPGLDVPFDQGTLFIGDASCTALPFPATSIAMPEIVVEGGITLSDEAANLFFDLAEISSTSGCGSEICAKRIELLVSELEIGTWDDDGAGGEPAVDGIRFSEGGANVGGVLILRVQDGLFAVSACAECPDPGLHFAEAAIEFPFGDEGMEVKELYAGPAGLRFEEAPGFEINDFEFEFSGVDIDFGEKTFDAGFVKVSRSSEENADDDFEGKFDELHLPFSFFNLPPEDFPTATAGFLRLGDEDDPPFSLCWGVFNDPDEQPDPEDYDCPATAFPFRIAEDEVSIPGFFLRSTSPKLEAFFPGARVTKEFIEIGDLPAIPMFGSTVDLGLTRLSKRGIYTESAVYARGGIEVGLKDFELEFDPAKPKETDVSISGGSFKKGGIGFSFSEFVAKKNDHDNNPGTPDIVIGGSFDFETQGFPVLRKVSGDAEIWAPDHFDVDINSIDEVDLGPLRLRNIRFEKAGPPPMSLLSRRGGGGAHALDDGNFYFTGGVGWGRFPDVFGEIEITNGRLTLLGMRGVWQPPGYPLSASPIFLQEIGAVWTGGSELSADIVLTAGPSVGYSPFISPSRLVTVRGAATLSAVGYIHSRANIRMFENPGFGGFPVGDGEFILGKVYRDGKFLGTGVYFTGRVYLFYGVFDAGVTGWMFEQGGGTYGASINGSMQVPGSVPVIGGMSFGSVGATLRGTVDPPSGAISGNVSITLFCIKWVGCTRIGVGFRIDSGGFSVSDDGRSALAFDGGYRRGGVQALTNFRMLGSRPADGMVSVSSTGLPVPQVMAFNVPAGVRDAVVRIDTTAVPGTASLELQFPTGQTFTKLNTPAVTEAVTVELEAGDVPIFYREASVPSSPTEMGLKEAAFLFQGALAFQDVPILDEDGNPTGETQEILAATDIPAGTYLVTIVPTGDVTGAPLDFLIGNHRPVLENVESESLGGDRYRVSFAVSDADDDPVTVRAHLALDPMRPALSYPMDPLAGVTSDEGEIVVDVADLAGQSISSPLHLFVSLDDGFGPPDYAPVTIVAPPVSPLAPPQVQGVVARAEADSVRLFWDPIVAAAAPGTVLKSYSVIVSETGPAGTTGETRTVSVPVPEEGSGGPELTEAFLADLLPGRVYRAVVAAMATQTLAGAGPPLCPCGTTPEPGETCHAGSIPAPPPCGTPGDLVLEHTGPPSVPIQFQLSGDGVNHLPRFVSAPGNVVELGTSYAALVRIEDLDADSLDVDLIPTEVPDPDAPPATIVVNPLAGLSVTDQGDGTWLLQYDAVSEDDIGTHPVTIEADDGTAKATLRFDLQVVHFGSVDPEATITSEPPGRVRLGETFVYQPEVVGTATELALRYRLAMSPEGMTVDPETGLVRFSPEDGQQGDHIVALEVLLDNAGCAACPLELAGSQTWTLTVLDNPFASYGATLSVVPGTQILSAAGGTAPIAIVNLSDEESMTWTAEVIEGDWFTVGPLAGGDGGTLDVSAPANPLEAAREGRVRITATAEGGGAAIGSPRIVEILQASAELSMLAVTPGTLDPFGLDSAVVPIGVSNAGGGTMPWEAIVAKGAEWLSLSGTTEGVNTGSFDVQFAANATGAERVGVVRVLATDQPDTPGSPFDVEVRQLGADLSVSATSPATEQVTRGGGTITVSLVIDNPTPRAAGGITLFLRIPAGLTMRATDASAASVAAATPRWQCPGGTTAGAVCTLDVGVLAAGTSTTRSATLVVDSILPEWMREARIEIRVDDDGAKGADALPDDNVAVVLAAIVSASSIPTAADAGLLALLLLLAVAAVVRLRMG